MKFYLHSREYIYNYRSWHGIEVARVKWNHSCDICPVSRNFIDPDALFSASRPELYLRVRYFRSTPKISLRNECRVIREANRSALTEDLVSPRAFCGARARYGGAGKCRRSRSGVRAVVIRHLSAVFPTLVSIHDGRKKGGGREYRDMDARAGGEYESLMRELNPRIPLAGGIALRKKRGSIKL